MDIYQRVFDNPAPENMLWIICSSEEETQLFKDWVLQYHSNTHTEFAHMGRGRYTALGVTQDSWYGTKYVIDRISNAPVPLYGHDWMMFDDWHALVCSEPELESLDLCDIESLL